MKSVVAAMMAVAIAAPAAAVTNLGFEDGNLNGWTAVGSAGTTSGFGAFTPYEGSQFAFVQAGLGEGVLSTLSRTFTVYGGHAITGRVGFQAGDYLPYNDFSTLTVTISNNSTTVFATDIATVGNYGNSGWVSFSFTAPQSGQYTLQLGVANQGDNSFSSTAFLDGVAVNAAIPEPASWAMLLTGFGLVGVAARRRTAVAA